MIKIYENKKILEKLFRENKTSPLLKTPEKDFQLDTQEQSVIVKKLSSALQNFAENECARNGK